MKISPALMVAIIGAAAVFFFMQQTARASVVPPLPRLTSGGWEYPPGTSPGPTDTTYRDPTGAVLFKPDYTGPVDWT